jgi:hypothetical protein
MATEQSPVEGHPWLRYLVLMLALSILFLFAWLLAVTVVPRWWAQFLGDRIDGRITVGTFYGLVAGFLFTLVPLVIARQAVRRVAWNVRAGILAVAVALAVPNLMTLGIVLGSGSGAHAGDRILDVDGPGFRVGTGLGAATAALLFALAIWWRLDARRDRRLRAELNARERAES